MGYMKLQKELTETGSTKPNHKYKHDQNDLKKDQRADRWRCIRKTYKSAVRPRSADYKPIFVLI